jgi:hypothetical protein
MTLATLAAVTSANGLVVLPILLLWQILEICGLDGSPGAAPQSSRARRNALGLAALLILTAGVLVAYFHDYRHPVIHPEIGASFARPARALHYLVLLLGSLFAPVGRYPAFAAGGALILLFVGLTCLHRDRLDRFAWYGLLFVLISAAMAALGRSGFGVAQALSSRYRILSILAFLMAYLLVLARVRTAAARAVIAGTRLLAVILNVLAYDRAEREMRGQKRRLEIDLGVWVARGEGLHYPHPDRAASLMEEALSRDVYRLPLR